MPIFGFIGTGNMGSILARAVCHNLPGNQVFLANRTPEKARLLAEELNCQATDNHTVAECADFIFLGVKPQAMAEMLSDISPILKKRGNGFILVSMATGLTISRIQKMAGEKYPVIRIMPNTPSDVGAGMILYACDESITKTEKNTFLDIMAGVGRLSVLPERLIDVGSVVIGSSVAFAALFLEAVADGAVACGMPRTYALEFAAQMLAGTGKLALEQRNHPGLLKDGCGSPGGATIQGIRALERGSFRGTVIEAVIASYERTVELK